MPAKKIPTFLCLMPGQTNGPDTVWVNTITAAMPVSALQTNLQLQAEPVAKDSFEVTANIANI